MNLKCLTTFSVYSLIEDTMVIYCDAFQFHPVYFIQKSIQLTFMISRSFPIFLMISHVFFPQRRLPLTLCDTFRSPPLQKFKKILLLLIRISHVCVCTCYISYLCKVNCEIGVAGFFEMPPKAKPPIIDADLFYGVVGDCLTDFFKNHTTQCSCEQVILNLNDELNNCKSLIVAQTALINQLYNAVIDLKFDLHKSQGPFQQASPSFKSAREKRRSDMEVKTNTLSDSSLATDITVYNNTNNLTAVRRQSFVNISQPSDTEKLQNANSPNLEILSSERSGKKR
jgi:hypothetical protein